MESFITSLAWIFLVLASSLTVLRIALWTWENFTKSGRRSRRLDRLMGHYYSWNIVKPALVIIFCAAWIWR